VVAPQYNLPNALAILTSVGFHHLTDKAWLTAVGKLRPDIMIGLADLPYGHTPGKKRRAKMVDRTHAYTRDGTKWLHESAEDSTQSPQPLYFAPILPIENTEQGIYLQDLEDELRPGISGLALYQSASLSIVPEGLDDLPRLCLSEPRTPQDVIRDVALGADMIAIPFIGELADAGIALDLVFSPAKEEDNGGDINKEPKPLAFNLWDTSFATTVAPISEGCQCYTCQKHHRAYIHHLLSAKEMLAWTLVQVHNHHVMDLLFSDIRQSIVDGTFEAKAALFEQTYESAFPAQTGLGPRYVFVEHMPCNLMLTGIHIYIGCEGIQAMSLDVTNRDETRARTGS
jgi:queuine tRNA-ribosyltransferase accessory subunit